MLKSLNNYRVEPTHHLSLLCPLIQQSRPLKISWQSYTIKPDLIKEVALKGLFLPESIKGACLTRCCDFLMGRLCALRALTDAGYNVKGSLAQLDDGQVDWPFKTRGSISHSHGIAIAVVANKSDVRYLGVDLEEIVEVANAKEMANLIAHDDEFTCLIGLGINFSIKFSLLFSAKEAIYKALYPHLRCFINFDEVTLVETNSNNILIFKLSAALQRRLGFTQIRVDYFILNTYVLTLVAH